jgi:GT2 family glycosyltransferase
MKVKHKPEPSSREIPPEEAAVLPFVTIAVCVFNGESTIESCLNSLLNLNYPKNKFTILVVDNGSTDRTPDILRQLPVRSVQEHQKGVGFARNKAWRSIDTEFIAFTDVDCIAHPDWLLDLTRCFDRAEIGAVGGRIITPGREPLARYYEKRKIVSNAEFSGDYPYSPPFLATANTLFRLAVIKKAGGFNPDFRAGEDADLCWRIQRLGYTIRYLPKGIIYHHHRTSLGALFNQSALYGRGGIQLYSVYRKRFGWSRWLWWGLYVRWLIAVLATPWGLFRADPLDRRIAFYDLIRFTGVITGRLKAALEFKVFVL